MSVTLTLAEAEVLAMAALAAHGVPEDLARPTAEALLTAEREGLASHGLTRLGFYMAQIDSGKVAADARPEVVRNGAVVRVDARAHLAFPAIAAGCDAGAAAARELGVAAVSITNSHHFGVAGHPVERLARDGLVALAFSNAPAAMAPWGGAVPLYGTNPIAFAAPRPEGAPLVIDLSLSHVARGKVMLAQKRGEPIPEGWALDRDGRPTTDADAAMAGSMLPSGGAKGAALALMVELLTAGLAGAHFAFEASSLFSPEGPPPRLAHLILVLDPARFAGDFTARAEAVFAAIAAQEGARLPGARRAATRSAAATHITLPAALVDELRALATPTREQRRG